MVARDWSVDLHMVEIVVHYLARAYQLRRLEPTLELIPSIEIHKIMGVLGFKYLDNICHDFQASILVPLLCVAPAKCSGVESTMDVIAADDGKFDRSILSRMTWRCQCHEYSNQYQQHRNNTQNEQQLGRNHRALSLFHEPLLLSFLLQLHLYTNQDKYSPFYKKPGNFPKYKPKTQNKHQKSTNNNCKWRLMLVNSILSMWVFSKYTLSV